MQSLGGVIGGEPTGVTEATTEIYVEAALFDPIRTAATGRRLEIVSDARYRFERGVDPAFVGPGLEIATRLILELCGGEPSEIVRAGAEPQWRRTYKLRPERMAGLGGLHVPPAESRAILEALGCMVGDAAEHDGSLTVSPPSWRGDIEGEADLVEEVLRVKGYDEIPPVPLPRETVISRPAIDARRRRVELVRRTLAERGLTEAVTFSFLSSKAAALFGGARPELTLVNPISAISMRCGRASCRTWSRRRGATPIAAFPMSRCSSWGRFTATPAPKVRRPSRRGCAPAVSARGTGASGRANPICTTRRPTRWRRSPPLGAPADNLQTAADPPQWYHPGRAGILRLGASVLGHFGELHPDVLEAFDVKGPVAAFEVFLDGVLLPRAGRGRAPLHALGVPAGRARFRLRCRSRYAGRDAAARGAWGRPQTRQRHPPVRRL